MQLNRKTFEKKTISVDRKVADNKMKLLRNSNRNFVQKKGGRGPYVG